MEPKLPIKELARLTGVKPGMIRYLEKVGLISPSVRTASGYRMFGPGHVKELEFVRKMYDLGFYAQQIKKLREIKLSALTPLEKRQALEAGFQEHVEYLDDRIKFFQALRARARDAAPTFAEDVLEGDC